MTINATTLSIYQLLHYYTYMVLRDSQRGQNLFEVTRISQYVLLINLIFKGGCRQESQTKCGVQGGRLFVQTFQEQTKSNSPNLVFDSQQHQTLCP